MGQQQNYQCRCSRARHSPAHQKAPHATAWTHLDDVVVDVLGVAVDQVDLLGVDVLQRLLVQAVVVHVLVVGFVYVPLFSDERRLRELLSGSGGGRERGE